MNAPTVIKFDYTQQVLLHLILNFTRVHHPTAKQLIQWHVRFCPGSTVSFVRRIDDHLLLNTCIPLAALVQVFVAVSTAKLTYNSA